MLAFLLSPPGRALASLSAVLVLAGGLYLKGRADGSAATETRWREAVQIERDRQIEENAAAKAAERARIAALEAEIAQRDAEIEALNEEARNDPDADRPAVNRDGVRRLNKLR